MFENCEVEIPEPYPYTNQPNSVIKHAELILPDAWQSKIENYDYLRQISTPFQKMHKQDK